MDSAVASMENLNKTEGNIELNLTKEKSPKKEGVKNESAAASSEDGFGVTPKKLDLDLTKNESSSEKCLAEIIYKKIDAFVELMQYIQVHVSLDLLERMQTFSPQELKMMDHQIKRFYSGQVADMNSSISDIIDLIQSSDTTEGWDDILNFALRIPKAVHFHFENYTNGAMNKCESVGGFKPFLNAHDYWSQLKKDIDLAERFIFITGWDLDPEIELVEGVTLFRLLEKKINENVEIHIALYKDEFFWFSQTTGNDSNPGIRNVTSDLRSNFKDFKNFKVELDKPRFGFSHHQKSIVIDGKIAFLGGIDLARGRYEDGNFFLQAPNWSISKWYNRELGHDRTKPRMPWRDIQCRITGDAVSDVLCNFKERWEYLSNFDRSATEMSNMSQIQSVPNEAQLDLKICRTFSSKNPITKEIERDRSILHAMIDAISNAKEFIYIENQFFISSSDCWRSPYTHDSLALNPVARYLIEALNKGVIVVIILPLYPDGDGPQHFQVQGILEFQRRTLDYMWYHSKDKEKLSVFALGKCESSFKNMIYVHSKLMIVDDSLMIIGSANINERSLGVDRDTEIAVIAKAELHNPAIQQFRMECLKQTCPNFDIPELNDRAINVLKGAAQKHWYQYKNHQDTEGALLMHPIQWDCKNGEAMCDSIPGFGKNSQPIDISRSLSLVSEFTASLLV